MSDARIRVVAEPLVDQKTDAIVTGATPELRPDQKGSSSRRVHEAAGPGLTRECRRLLSCGVGKAKISKGYKLPARHVIHAVSGGDEGEGEATLRERYRSSLALAAKHDLDRVALPPLGEAEGVAPERDAEIALEVIEAFLADHQEFDEVRLCCEGSEEFEIFSRAVSAH